MKIVENPHYKSVINLLIGILRMRELEISDYLYVKHGG
jgi:hypothetical protein